MKHPLRTYLDGRRITVEAFARVAGCHPRTLYRLMRGEHRVTGETAMRLARVTGIPIATFIPLQEGHDATPKKPTVGELQEAARARRAGDAGAV